MQARDENEKKRMIDMAPPLVDVAIAREAATSPAADRPSRSCDARIAIAIDDRSAVRIPGPASRSSAHRIAPQGRSSASLTALPPAWPV
jgi:hypothetical protein